MRTLMTQTRRLMCNVPPVQEFNLCNNQIGDAGVTALANACASGSMASLESLYMDDGPLGTEHPGLKTACEARGIKLIYCRGIDGVWVSV